jgi:GNAT superfamily N-acetyltransferase
MAVSILPFANAHVDAAVSLLAARYIVHRKLEPRLPPAYEEAASCRRLIETVFSGPSSGVVAVRDGEVVGYMLGRFGIWALRRYAELRPHCHALADGEDAELYREMYASVAPRWFKSGHFAHSAMAMACDKTAIEAFFSLGFGQSGFHCWRDLSPVGGTEAEVVIRRAGVEDHETVVQLQLGLGRYNAGSAIFRPFIMPAPDEMERWATRLKENLTKEDHAYWLAYVDGEAVALMTFVQPERDDLTTPENSIYLGIGFVEEGTRLGGIGTAMVNRGLAWAREQGHEHCTVGFFSTNLIGARFWRDNGFKPLVVNLERMVDERIAWADGTNA